MVKSVSSPLRSFLIALIVLAFSAAAAGQEPAGTAIDAAGITFFDTVNAHGLLLTLAAPDGRVKRYELPAGAAPVFDLGGAGLADGAYRWELIELGPPRVRGRDAEGAPAAFQARSGSFTVVAGSVLPAELESNAPKALPGVPTKDFVIADDLIVQFSACIGFDCVNGEVFDFDTLRLKENNLRIKFEDTSTLAGFPTTDWQLTANDSASGGQNKFSIEDVSAGRVPFTVLGAAPSNALFVDAGGRVGFGTSTPVLNLHVATGNTPALRLEQNGSSGFTPQTWDLAGNETSFFLRDATFGSRLPLRVRPNAPSSSIDIAPASGNVGMGTSAPTASLHVRRTDGTAKLFVEEASATNGDREQLKFKNTGTTRLSLDATGSATGRNWRITSANNGDFTINAEGLGLTQMRIDGAGNVTIPAGAAYLGSDRTQKRDIRPVDPADVLARVADVPVATWSWQHESGPVRHLGPMSQDFHAAFGLGQDDRTIGINDLAGVALAAIQGLQAENAAKDRAIAALEARIAALEAARP